MATRDQLKKEFDNGECPSREDYYAIFDSTINFDEDGIRPPDDNNPMVIKGRGINEGLLKFTAGDENPDFQWLISLNSYENNGLTIQNSKVANTPLFFIDNKSGQVGIGTSNPKSVLHVKGGLTVDAVRSPFGEINGRSELGMLKITSNTFDKDDSISSIGLISSNLPVSQAGSIVLTFGNNTGDAIVNFMSNNNNKKSFETVTHIDSKGNIFANDFMINEWVEQKTIFNRDIKPIKSIIYEDNIFVCQFPNIFQIFKREGLVWKLDKSLEIKNLVTCFFAGRRGLIAGEKHIYYIEKNVNLNIDLNTEIQIIPDNDKYDSILSVANFRNGIDDYAIIGIKSDKPSANNKVWIIKNSKLPPIQVIEQTSDAFASSIDMCFPYLAIGTPRSDQPGLVYLYIWDEAKQLFYKLGQPIKGNSQETDGFGQSIKINNNKIIIGAPFQNVNLGAAYVGELTPSGIINLCELVFPQGTIGTKRGSSVAINSDYAFVGAPSGQNSLGGVCWFKFDGNSWDFFQFFMENAISDTYVGGLGNSVDIYGSFAIATAWGFKTESTISFFLFLDSIKKIVKVISA